MEIKIKRLTLENVNSIQDRIDRENPLELKFIFEPGHFIDSTGIGLLLHYTVHLHLRVTLEGLSDQYITVFRLAKLYDKFTFV